MPKIYLAFYKGTRPGRSPKSLLWRFADFVIKKYTQSIYSHVELAIEIDAQAGVYECFSASGRDGGVRAKVMKMPHYKWDLIDISNIGLNGKDAAALAESIRDYYDITHGRPYDWLGVLLYPLGVHRRNAYFCSEWCANALSLPRGHFPPAGLHAMFRPLDEGGK